MRTEWVMAPSGVLKNPGASHDTPAGLRLKPSIPSHVAPPSWERKRPCGTVPANQTSGWLMWPGVSQKFASTARGFATGPFAAPPAGAAAAGSPEEPPAAEAGARAGTLGKAGGRTASFQVRPRSVE